MITNRMMSGNVTFFLILILRCIGRCVPSLSYVSSYAIQFFPGLAVQPRKGEFLSLFPLGPSIVLEGGLVVSVFKVIFVGLEWETVRRHACYMSKPLQAPFRDIFTDGVCDVESAPDILIP